MPRQHLIERAYSHRVVQVDRDAGVIRGVKILGRVSANGREYSTPALHQAARCYEGLGVNMNHPDRSHPHLERPVQDGFGWLEGVEVKADGVYGDLHFLKSHAMAGPICEAAERRPDRFGLSHNATGNVVEKDGQRIVESIEQVRSVDIVQRPATTQGLFESTSDSTAATPILTDGQPDPAAELRAGVQALLDDAALSLAELVDSLTELIKQYATEDAEVANTNESLEAQLSGLQAELTEARAGNAALQELASAGLSPTPVRVKALIPLTESQDREALIQDWLRAGTIQSRPVPRPQSSPPILESIEHSDTRNAAEMARRFNALC